MTVETQQISHPVESKEKPNYLDIFATTPSGGVVGIPFKMLHTTISEDEARRSSTHSEGPPTVYGLINTKTGERSIWIKDGNHRLYNTVENKRYEAKINGTYIDEETFIDTLLIEVKRVTSNPDNEDDIRYMWDCAGKYTNMEFPKEEV